MVILLIASTIYLINKIKNGDVSLKQAVNDQYELK